MSNGASRLFNVMKNTSESTNTTPSQIVSLTTKSIQPLIFSRDERLEIPEEFCIFSKLIKKEDIKVGDVLTAMVFNEGQNYFIEHNNDDGLIIVNQKELQDIVDNLEDEINDLNTKINNKNIITAGASNSVTASGTGELQIPITQALEQIGNKFTIDNNKIYVGSEINKVLISTQVYFNLAANRGSALNIYIKKNGLTVNGLTNSGYSSTAVRNATLPVAPMLVPVQEGDYFEYYAYVYNGDVIRSEQATTFLTIEAVN